MFEIGFPEVLVIAAITLVVVGPEKIPQLIKTVSLFLKRFRLYFENIKQEIEKDGTPEVVIVTEGVFDAILIDGVSIQGNSIGAEQAHLISKLGQRVILCPDRDDAGKDLIEQALALDWEISFPPWHAEIKDAADA